MKILKDFCAIDFETMTPKRSSACSIGMAKVRDGEIVETFYSLIKPIPDDSIRYNTFIHGITPEMVKDAPTFDQLWPQIQSMIEDFPILAHNAVFDKSVLLNNLDYYYLSTSNNFKFYCTYKLCGYSLEDACKKYKVNLNKHHNAVEDAKACADLYLKLSKEYKDDLYFDEFEITETNVPSHISIDRSDKEIFREIYRKRSFPSEAIDKESGYLFNKNVAITGQFAYYSDLKLFKEQLNYYGVNLQSSMNKETDILIVGKYGSESIINKAVNGIKGGKKIEILNELDLKKHIHPQPTILQCEGIIKNDLIQGNNKIYDDGFCSSSITTIPIDYIEGFYPEDEILDKTTIFYNKRVNVRGIFKGYDRNYGVEKILQKLGADVRGPMNSKTEIIVVSDEHYEYWGPKRIIDKSQVGKINLEEMKIITESELNDILKSASID